MLRRALADRVSKKCLQPPLTEKNFDRFAKDSGRIISLDGFKTLLNLYPKEVFSQAPDSGRTPLQMAVRLHESSMISYQDVSSIAKAVIKHCPSSVFLPAGADWAGITADRLLKSLKPTESTENTRSRSDTEELLKRACVGHREWKWDKKKGEYVYDDMWLAKKALLYQDIKSRNPLIPWSYRCPCCLTNKQNYSVFSV